MLDLSLSFPLSRFSRLIFQHGRASVAMFKYMYKDPSNNLACRFEDYDLDETDRIFIEEQIAGPLLEANGVRHYDIV